MISSMMEASTCFLIQGRSVIRINIIGLPASYHRHLLPRLLQPLMPDSPQHMFCSFAKLLLIPGLLCPALLLHISVQKLTLHHDVHSADSPSLLILAS